MPNTNEISPTSAAPTKHQTNVNTLNNVPSKPGALTMTTKVLIGIGIGSFVFLGVSAAVIFGTMALTKTGLFAATESTTIATTTNATSLLPANCSTGVYVTTSNTCTSLGTAFNCTSTTSLCSSQNMAGATSIFNGSSMSNLDDVQTTVTIPFNLSLYGTSGSTIGVSTNGVFCLGSCTIAYSTSSLPTTNFLNPTVFLHSQDLYIFANTSQSISYVIQGTAPSRMIIFYYYLAGISSSNSLVQMYVTMYENIPNVVRVEYSYSYNNGSTALIGIQQTSTGPSLLYSYQQSVITNGTVLIYNT